MAIGGTNRYPTLQAIADLFRASINDDFAGATNTPGEGLIAYNTAPFMLVFMNQAIRDVYSDLRNIGDPQLILDNYLLIGIPALAAADPTIQVALTDSGYFDGTQVNSQWTLPANCSSVERLWERWSGSGSDFLPMTPAQAGLPGVFQVDRMGLWEMRQNAIWMPGCLVSVDLRLRCTISFPDYLNPDTIDFTTTYVPILDCTNAVVAKMLVQYARRFAPDQYQVAALEETKFMDKLKQETIHQRQQTVFTRDDFGQEATEGFNWMWQL